MPLTKDEELILGSYDKARNIMSVLQPWLLSPEALQNLRSIADVTKDDPDKLVYHCWKDVKDCKFFDPAVGFTHMVPAIVGSEEAGYHVDPVVAAVARRVISPEDGSVGRLPFLWQLERQNRRETAAEERRL